MFAEYDEIQELTNSWGKLGEVKNLTTISYRKFDYSVFEFSLGNPAPETPTLILSGGVHGLERIGTWVTLSFMKHLVARLPWDEQLQEHLQKLRIVFIPLVNPAGMHHFRRSNGNGVDLMRNAPIQADHASWGVGGQSYSPSFPWFRGNPEQTAEGMELEAKALVAAVQREITRSKCTIALDLHSGFGMVDQLWFPYAKSKEIFAKIHQVNAFNRMLDQVLPHHVYLFEPQAKHYTTHGDLWDYLLTKEIGGNTFLPLTLEMGSWNWIKKNPLQLFSFLGPFNPIKPHRQKRAMRRHLPLFDFLMHATSSNESWSQCDHDLNRADAIRKWYREVM